MKTIGVIGSGVMGTGVSQSLVQAGYQVILVDTAKKILDRAKEDIYNKIRLQAFFRASSDRVLDPDDAIAQICFTTDYQQLKAAEYIIENVTEKWEVKEYSLAFPHWGWKQIRVRSN